MTALSQNRPANPFSGKKPPKRSGGIFYWLLGLAVLFLVWWIWKHSGGRAGDQAAASTNKIPAKATKFVTNSAPAKLPLQLITKKPSLTNQATPIIIATKTNGVVQISIVTNVATTNVVAMVSTNALLPRPVQNVFEAQLVLAQRGISSGSLDGVAGRQTRSAFVAFQQSEGLATNGLLDAGTKAKLILTTAPYTNYVVTSNDLARLQPLASTWLGKSRQSALDYENILELVAEKFWSHPNFIRRLNPQINWTNVVADVAVKVPNVDSPKARGRAALIRIKLADKVLEAFDAKTNLLAHFPCSIAQRVEKRPVGELHVAVMAPNPNYTFDPEVFPESAEARELKQKLMLPPGPNNPVGLAWIGLDRPGYGIHGTPRPEEVGRTESHGCFRLANWNAEFLLHLVSLGTPVVVEP